ncbi:protein VACUOLELESS GAMETOPHYTES-like [Typha angustifolia]|uniref:protein VACUOLELESS GAMETOPHYTES-like n=1 Tax=Typha angustifolia TaxID=59011 RepID=UPI003C2D9E3B
MASSISHFTHTNHKLEKILRETSFTRDLCKQRGTAGVRYRCDVCDFDLHEHCSVCPNTLPTFFAHPWHPLTLSPPPSDPRVCDICREPLNGYTYRCEPCGFDLHPLCMLTPQTVRTNLHRAHRLTLIPAGPCYCSGCGELCLVWRYRCGLCGVELHPQCLHRSPSKSTSNGAGHNDGGGDGGGEGGGGRARKVAVKVGKQVVLHSLAHGVSAILL